MTDLPDQSVDVTITDPPYPNRLQLFSESIVDGYAALYLACRKTKKYIVFFWSNDKIPQAPPGWYEVARHIWHKPDCKSITHYENIIVWSKDYKRKISRVWSIPILDYRSLRDWKPHPTQKPVRLLRYLLDLYTREGDTVLDPFVGTGTTAVACKHMNRHYIAFDSDPEYVKMARQRLTSRKKEDEPGNEPEATNDVPEQDSEETAEAAPLEESTQELPPDDIPSDAGLLDTRQEPQERDARRPPATAHFMSPTVHATSRDRAPRVPTSRQQAGKPRRPPKTGAASIARHPVRTRA